MADRADQKRIMDGIRERELKMRHKAILVLAAVLLISLLATGSASAYMGLECKAVRLGGYGGTMTLWIGMVHLDDNPKWTGDYRWFKVQPLPADRKKEMLALAMTAMTAGKKLYVLVRDLEESYPEIIELYLLSDPVGE